jgi:hypothetical protein
MYIIPILDTMITIPIICHIAMQKNKDFSRCLCEAIEKTSRERQQTENPPFSESPKGGAFIPLRFYHLPLERSYLFHKFIELSNIHLLRRI